MTIQEFTGIMAFVTSAAVASAVLQRLLSLEQVRVSPLPTSIRQAARARHSSFAMSVAVPWC